jgi:hypothetical protein
LSAYQAGLECALYRRHHGPDDKDHMPWAANTLLIEDRQEKAFSWRISQGKKLF